MVDNKFYKSLLENFNFEPTSEQSTVLQELANFISNKDDVFLLKGYAGTGKTTLINCLVKGLNKVRKKTILLAPTGRAAKVITQYTKKTANTIHRHIYKSKSNGDAIKFILASNKSENTFYIVDEASMINNYSNSSDIFESSLLDDLIKFVNEGKNCKLIFIGDTAQLPPVKSNISPALDESNLIMNYAKRVNTQELKEVIRQKQNSGILYNATALRNLQKEIFFDSFKFELNSFSDIKRLVVSDDILNSLLSSYQTEKGTENTIVIVRSNKRANEYNQQIRAKIFKRDNELCIGDYLMVVRNNYFWPKDRDLKQSGFIANGDIIEVLEICNYKDLYSFRFATIKVKMIDYPDEAPFITIIMLDTLTTETPNLDYESSNRLYKEVGKDYTGEKTKSKRYMKIKSNQYFNALQVKYSYAITCHKSQGGQWKNVFVEQAYLPNGIDLDYLRWLYTALTRATKNLYLIGFSNEYFLEN